ncbi:MAG TPA: glycerol-3-phosphate 1-O-acyltransferase PlsY [Thermoanaerobaculia bacterium]|nr:glycerol-3-phosphate 1-O-acyltransferase PlsY [Thermoanaerobaculia bacterium]
MPFILATAAYLAGSIPFSFLVAKFFAGKDVRKEGSRNVGATNVVRTAGRVPGAIALVLDLAKGYAAVELARWIISRPDWPFRPDAGGGALQSQAFWIALAGLLAVIGHIYPVWLRFHGGKGVATAAGAFLAMNPVVAGGAAIVFLIVIVATRYVSLASILSAASVPLLFRFFVESAPFWQIVVSIAMSLLVIVRHHSNIARLAQGTERKLGER